MLDAPTAVLQPAFIVPKEPDEKRSHRLLWLRISIAGSDQGLRKSSPFGSITVPPI